MILSEKNQSIVSITIKKIIDNENQLQLSSMLAVSGKNLGHAGLPTFIGHYKFFFSNF